MIMNIIEYEVGSHVDVNMSHRQGIVNTTYDKLVSILGEPTYTDMDRHEKVNCEWAIKVTYQDPYSDDPEDTVTKVATIYNWCTGNIPYDLYGWHIGGFDLDSEHLVHIIINDQIKPVE
jgi:hypothetical protein